MYKSVFHLSKMDCPSEEQLVRMKLANFDTITSLAFDLPNRTVEIVHTSGVHQIGEALDALNLGQKLIATEKTEGQALATTSREERKVLWQVLGINLFFFVVELSAGFIANSMGLVADGLDMLADAIVYGLSLLAVGATILKKKRVALISGYFQLLLALLGFTEVARRFFGSGETPHFKTMMIVSVLALIANITSLYLLQRSKSKDVHMKASTICTSNDVIANIGVILAAALVLVSASKIPDLIVGSIVFFLVARGSFKILRLAK